MLGEHYRQALNLRERPGTGHKVFQNEIIDYQRSDKAQCQLYSVAAGLFTYEQDKRNGYPHIAGIADNGEKRQYRVGYGVAKLLEKEKNGSVDVIYDIQRYHLWVVLYTKWCCFSMIYRYCDMIYGVAL